ncbi:MAG TPA: hypothetical protein VMY88_12695 [Acidimicrobiales bacterium]|nr:hypothetical protein [Acidimicrobiales bacterium]
MTSSGYVAPVCEFALGMACLAFAGTVVFALRLGGVVATLTADRGIHSGDFAAVPLVLVGVALLVGAVRPSAAG